MKDFIKKNLVPKIKEIYENISYAPSVSSAKYKAFFGGDGVYFCLSDEYADLYDEVISSILSRSDFDEKFSEEYIDKILKSLISRLILNSQSINLEEELKSLIEELSNFDQSYRVLVPLFGIVMSEDVFEAGNVKLLKVTKSTIDSIFLDIKNIVLLTNNTEEEKQKDIESQKVSS